MHLIKDQIELFIAYSPINQFQFCLLGLLLSTNTIVMLNESCSVFIFCFLRPIELMVIPIGHFHI